MTYRVRRLRIPPPIAALIRSLHPRLKRKVRTALEQILIDPRSGKALKNELSGLWSFRVGKFRVIYRLHDKYVDLVALGPRGRIYEETYRLVVKSQNP